MLFLEVQLVVVTEKGTNAVVLLIVVFYYVIAWMRKS